MSARVASILGHMRAAGCIGSAEDPNRAAHDLLDFWFRTAEDEAVWNRGSFPPKSCERRWWGGGAALDAEIKQRYEKLLLAAAAVGEAITAEGTIEAKERFLAAAEEARKAKIPPINLSSFDPDQSALQIVRSWVAPLLNDDEAKASSSAHTLLAYVILQDQFSRNVFRGLPEAFSFDRYTVPVVRYAIAHGLQRQLKPFEQFFLFMPLEHSENVEDQELAVRMHDELTDLVREEQSLGNYMRKVGEDKAGRRVIIERFGRYPPRNEQLSRSSTPAEVTYLEQRRRSREEQLASKKQQEVAGEGIAASEMDESNFIFQLDGPKEEAPRKGAE